MARQVRSLKTREEVDVYTNLVAAIIHTLTSSRGALRPFCIESVYLFKSHDLLAELEVTRAKVVVATGIRVTQWNAAVGDVPFELNRIPERPLGHTPLEPPRPDTPCQSRSLPEQLQSEVHLQCSRNTSGHLGLLCDLGLWHRGAGRR